jgi:HD-like signal output (HDOD) protein
MELPIHTSKRLTEILDDSDLPPISSIAAQLVETLSKEQIDLTYLRDMIAQDPSLTASVLRWANSPIYGVARQINTLDAAISILGVSRVRVRAIAFFITNAFEPPIGINRDEFWTSCMHSAGYAMWMALAVGLNESEAWLTAMLVRLGELIIGRIDPPTLLVIESKPLSVQERWQLEHDRFGFDEGNVIAEVTRLWFFPDSMVDALHKCANPMNFMSFSQLGAIVHLAMLLADMESVDEESLAKLPHDVVSALGIEVKWMAQHIPARSTFTESKTK